MPEKNKKGQCHSRESSVTFQSPGLTAQVRNKHERNQHIFQTADDGQRKMIDGQRNTEGEKFPHHDGKRHGWFRRMVWADVGRMP